LGGIGAAEHQKMASRVASKIRRERKELVWLRLGGFFMLFTLEIAIGPVENM